MDVTLNTLCLVAIAVALWVIAVFGINISH
jgi:hypothetical protein